MVSCRMFMLALHTIWRFCLSNIVSPSVRGLGGITEYRTYFYNTTHHTTTDHELRTNDEPAELPARPTL